jgi:cytochrome c biogenesis factor
LITKDFSQNLYKQMLFWAKIAWFFLTFGIVLGSYWAYSELGWGGWWFWDPVENISLIPWLLNTGPYSLPTSFNKERSIKTLVTQLSSVLIYCSSVWNIPGEIKLDCLCS